MYVQYSQKVSGTVTLKFMFVHYCLSIYQIYCFALWRITNVSCFLQNVKFDWELGLLLGHIDNNAQKLYQLISGSTVCVYIHNLCMYRCSTNGYIFSVDAFYGIYFQTVLYLKYPV